MRAGLAPALSNDEIPGSRAWPLRICTPGSQSLTALAEQLAAETALDTRATSDQLRADPAAAVPLAHEACAAADQPDGRLILIVDQFEELLAPNVSPAERAAFAAALVALASRPC